MKIPDIGLSKLPKSIWALFWVRLIVSAGNFVFPFLTLILTARLNWNARAAGLFLSLVQLSALPLIMLGGKISDSLGKKRIILFGQTAALALFSACLFVGFRSFLPYLIGLASICLSMTWPVSGALVADLVGPEQRKQSYALLYWGNNLGFSVGPIAAGFLFRAAPQYMFLGNATALGVSIFLLHHFVPEAAKKYPMEEDKRASLEGASSSSMLTLLRERPNILIFSFLVAIMNFVYSQQMFSLPLYLNSSRGAVGSELFGAAMTTNGLTVVVFTLALTRLTARIAPLLLIMAASVFYGIGFGILSFGSSTPIVLFSTFVWTIGEILAATNINVYVASQSPLTHRGRVNAFTSFITNLGPMVGPLLSGVFIDRYGIAVVWPSAFIIAIAASALIFLLFSVERSRGKQPQIHV